MIAKRYKRILNFVAGPVLFVLLAVSIYHKLAQRPDLGQSWDNIRILFHTHAYLLGILILLMLVNWGLESLKWKILISSVQRISFFRAFKAILSGLSFSLFMPNGSGEYLGRMLFMDEGKKLRSVAVSFVGSIAQVLITLVAGVIGLIYIFSEVPAAHLQLQGLSVFWLKGLIYAVGTAIVILLVMYFKVSLFTKWLIKIPFINKNRIFIQSLEGYDWKILGQVLGVSLLRYGIFIMQYLLVFYLLGVDISVANGICGTCVLFLILAIIPTIPLVDIGIRSEVSIQIFGLMTTNIVGIVSTAALIWIVNIILPSVIGSLFTLGIKLFKEK